MPIARKWMASLAVLAMLGCSRVDVEAERSGALATHRTSAVNVSPHGEMAYAFAKTTTTLTGPEGKPLLLPAKSVTVWRKGADGAWKCVVDTWSDDAPPAPKL